MLTRRDWLRTSLAGAATAIVAGALPGHLLAAPNTAGGPNDLTVYKSPTCGCCKAWVEHMTKAGFKVTSHDIADMTEVKRNLGVPNDLESCHTAILGKYVIEGHVPADLVKKMQKEQPKIVGLAVPGMPAGSPGMEVGRKDAYDVIAFEKSGKQSVYAKR